MEKKNITTPQAAQKQSEQFREKQTFNRAPARTVQQETQSTGRVPFIIGWKKEIGASSLLTKNSGSIV